MSACAGCGREVRKLLEEPGTGKRLCLTCLAKGLPPGSPTSVTHYQSTAETRITERRIQARFMAELAVELIPGHVAGSKVVYPCETTDLSLGGASIRWTHCSMGSGSPPGEIHKGCLLSAYSHTLAQGATFDAVLHLPDGPFLLRAQVAYAQQYPAEGVEYVGLVFVSLDEAGVARLKPLFQSPA